MKQPATIPEYKQFCKALKMKILKQKDEIDRQNKQIQRLTNQNANLKRNSASNQTLQRKQGEISSPYKSLTSNRKESPQITSLQTMKGKLQVMNKFKKAVCQFGITPQSIFRIADLPYRSEVQADYFRKILAKIDLGLTQLQISALIYLFDQSCTGFITRDDYNDTLYAFRISLEQSYLQYTGFCLEKFASILAENKIEPLKLFEEMQGKSTSGLQINQFYEKIKGKFGKLLTLKQIMGTFGAIDLQTDGLVCKSNFIYSVTAAINKLQSSLFRKQGQQSHSNNKSRVSIKKPNSNPNNIHNTSQIQPQNTQVSNFYPSRKNLNGSSYVEPNNQVDEGFVDQSQQQIIALIEKQSKITLHQIYQQICRHALDKRITLFDFKKIINSIQVGGNKLDPKLGNLLFKAIDYNKGGSIYFKQLIYFYLRHQSDVSIIFHLFGIYFKNNDLNSQKFWFLNGISADADVSKAKFFEVMAKTFGTNDLVNDFWAKLWNYFDKGKGVISVSTVNKQLNKYEHTD